MKKLLPLLIIALLFASCRQSFVEKTLKDVGKGKYRAHKIGNSIFWENGLFFNNLDKNNPFSDIEIVNDFLDKSEEYYKKNEDNKILALFETNVLFEKITFVSSMKSTKDIYKRKDFPNSEKNKFIFEYGGSMDTYESLNKLDKEQHEKDKNAFGYKEYKDHYVYCETQNTPMYIYKYKLDNKYIATVATVKIDGKWKIIYLFITY